jgi:hypothetical protein
MMATDGETPEGLARYYEYPDCFVGRGLAKEGLADWKGALADYNKAITLWGGNAVSIENDNGEVPKIPKPTTNLLDINPYVLTFRGNVLSQLVSF